MAARARRKRTRASAGEAPADARERILNAALAVFSERGFEGARTREIAERADANLGLIKYYYDTKEKLWQAAVSRAFEQLRAEVGELVFAAAEPDTAGERARLERLLRSGVHFMARHPEFMRLMNDEGKRDGPRMRFLTDRFVKPMAVALARRVDAARAAARLPAISPVSTHYIALGAVGLVFSQAPECLRLMGVDPTTEEFASAHADAVVRLLLGPVATPGPPSDRSA